MSIIANVYEVSENSKDIAILIKILQEGALKNLSKLKIIHLQERK